MKTVLSILISILSSLIFFGCGDNDYEKAKVKYGMKRYEKNSEQCDSTHCAKIQFNYPWIKGAFNDQVKDSIKKYIKNTLLENYSHESPSATLDSMAWVFFKDYQETTNEFSEYKLSWELNNTISVIYNDNSIVSFQSEFYHFTGGAHGNGGNYFTNFNSRDGKRLALSDLLVSGYEKELKDIAEKIFRKDKELSHDVNLEEAGFWFVDNKFSLNENFGIKNEGLVFYFNSYEIAPYSMGSTEFLIPYSDIKKLINPEGLLEKVAQM
jgi:hypothetical protein